jgi:hypothetical protein
MTMRTCYLQSCHRKHFALDLCHAHWSRQRRWGEVREDVPIRGRLTLVGTPNSAGYVFLFTDRQHTSVYEHQFIMMQMLGRSLLDGEEVHHKNGRHGDNRPENLEIWVTKQPKGQRPEDLVEWAHEILERYDGS